MTTVTATEPKKKRRLRLPRRPTFTVSPTGLRTLAMREHLHLDDQGTLTAWYLLGEQQWDWRSAHEHANLIHQQAQRWADLAGTGRKVHLRGTRRAFPHQEWAERLHKASPDRLPDVPGAEPWAGDQNTPGFLAVSQDKIASTGLDDPAWLIGIQIGTVPKQHRTRDGLDLILAGNMALATIRGELATVTQAVAGAGFNATPATEQQLAYLMHVSIGLGLPAAGPAGLGRGWTEDEMGEFTAPVTVTETPLAPTVVVEGVRRGRRITRHVAVLSASAITADRDVERVHQEPFLAAAARLPFPVEVSLHLEFPTKEDLLRAAEDDDRLIRGVEDEFTKHNRGVPLDVQEASAESKRITATIRSGAREDALRAVGTIRVAVWGDTEDEALATASTLIANFRSDQGIVFRLDKPQYALSRGFIPGEPDAPVGHRQPPMPCNFLAHAVPNAAQRLGDGIGPYLGYTSRAVCFEPSRGPETNQSGVIVVSARPGMGKSYLNGVLAEANARRGRTTVILDPAGMAARLTELPHLAPYSQVVNLAASKPGELNPYALVPDPPHSLGKEWREATNDAEAQRRELVITLLGMLLPVSTMRRDGVESCLSDAVRRAAAGRESNLWGVVAALQSVADDTNAPDRLIATGLSKEITGLAGMPRTSGMFPTRTGEVYSPTPRDEIAHPEMVAARATLTVVTLQGLEQPMDGSDPHGWTPAQRAGRALMHLAAWYASALVYDGTNKPKMIVLDEEHLFAQRGLGRALVERLARDSRKWNIAVILSSQNPTDMFAVEELDNLVGVAFVGGTPSAEVARDQLRLLRVPPGAGYEQRLAGLEPGQWIMRDLEGRVGLLHVDLEHHRPHVHDVLNTTPPSHGEPILGWT